MTAVITNPKYVFGTLGIVGLFVLLQYRKFLKSSNSSKSSVTKPKVPEKVSFVGPSEYAVLTALIDAMIPSHSLEECKTFLKEYVPGSIFELLGENKIKKCMGYFCSGAVNYGTNRHFAETIEIFCSKEEKTQLYLLLKALSTSVGCLLLTGYPLPFQELPLEIRQGILRSFAGSKFVALRNVFQTFRRLAGNLYLSYANPGEKNPNWEALDYHPEIAISTNDYTSTTASPSSTDKLKPIKENKDRILRSMVHYDHVRKVLGTSSPSSGQPAVEELKVDIVIIGSGSGGGVVAHELVNAGYQVLVVEKNGYYRAKDFQAWRESEAMANCYDKAGLLTSNDGTVVILAGSCVGGGSTINWSASFAPPPTVLEDWSTIHGLEDNFGANGDFHDSFQAVQKLFSINTKFSYYPKTDEISAEATEGGASAPSFAMNENNRALWKGAEALQLHVEKIPRNVTSCVNCGHCGYGCSHESKQSTVHALLEPLLWAQYQHEYESETKKETNTNKEETAPKKTAGKLYILPDCHVKEIVYHETKQGKKQAVGVVGNVTIYEAGNVKEGVLRKVKSIQPVRILANQIVCAAGSIQTPALLLRSKFTHPLIGCYLTLHPVIPCIGIAHKVQTGLNSGVSMGVVVKDAVYQFQQEHKHPLPSSEVPYPYASKHPIAIETPPAHPGITGLILPWEHDIPYKLASMFQPQILAFINFPRDHAMKHNRVTIDGEGHPVIHYSIAQEDEGDMLIAAEIMMRIMYASQQEGKDESQLDGMLITNSSEWWVKDRTQSADVNAKKFEEYITAAKERKIVPCHSTVLSAHQMSSCRMAKNEQEGPTSPDGTLFECENVFIADGSVLPTSLGINPMITIESVAHMIAQKIIRKLASTASN